MKAPLFAFVRCISGSALAPFLGCLTWLMICHTQALAQGATNCIPRPAGLIAWWPGDGFAFDVVGTNHATLENGVGYAPGIAGQAFSFAGNGGYVQLPDNIVPYPNSGTGRRPFSFEVWFETKQGGVIFGQQSGAANTAVSGTVPGLYVGTDGKLRAEMFWGGSVSPLTTSTAVNDGRIHHAVVTYDGTTETLYLDSSRVGSQAMTQMAYTTVDSYQLGTGLTSGWPGGNGGWYAYQGLIDEPSLYSRALSASEVATLFAAANAGKCYTNNPAPVFVQQPSSQPGLAGMQLSLLAAAMGSPRPSYGWLFNGIPIPTGTNATLVIANLASINAGDYRVVASNLFGSATSLVAHVTFVTNSFRSAQDLYQAGFNHDGFYTIDPDGPGGQAPFATYCLMSLSGGGWTRLTSTVAKSPLNSDPNRSREYLYVKNGATLWYRSPITKLVWDWSSGKDLYGTYYYSSGSGQGSFNVTPSGEHQLYGVGGSSGPFQTAKCLIYYWDYYDPANAQTDICQDIPGIFGGGCAGPVTVYIREQIATTQRLLQLTAAPANGGVLTGAGSYPDGTRSTISATPASGYRFEYWIGDGIADTNATTTTVLMNQARNLTAQFIKVWNLTVGASPVDAGSVSGSGVYDDGALAAISALPNSGTMFLGWLGGGVADPNASRTTVLMNQDRQVTAHFTAPDLQVVSVSMPQQAWTGRGFDVTWVVTNAGQSVAVGPWVDRLYLTATNQLNTNRDQLLGDFPFLGRLAPGESVQLVQTVTIYQTGITNGAYYVSVLTDATNSVLEGFGETNNFGLSTSIIAVQVTPLPDLSVLSVDAPTNGIGGQPISVSWVVCNHGGADTDVPIWYDHLYLSPTTNIANAVSDYGQFANPYYLAAGDCYEQTATVTLPIGVGGPRYLIVSTDATGLLAEGNKANNTGATVVPISIQLVRPGFLHVESVQVAPSPPTTVWAGGSVTVTWTVKNTGQSTITGTWDDEVTLSPTPSYDFVHGYWDVIHHIFFTGPLVAGQTYSQTEQFTVPQGIAPGNWYAAPIVDTHFLAGGNGAIGSGNIGRDQNSALVQVALPPPSDLEVTAVSAPTNAVAGQPINVGWTVVNNGNNQTSASYWYDAIYLTPNPTFDPNHSLLVGTFGHWGALDLTSNYTQHISITVPADMLGTNAYETNHLFVVADAGDAVVEFSKTNNVLGIAHPIFIRQLPPADLAVTALTAPFTVVAGRTATVSWKVANQGAGATSVGTWTDSIYLSPGPILSSASAKWLGDVPHSGALDPGDSYTQTQDFSVPFCPIGSFYVVVVADGGHAVSENGALSNHARASNAPMRIWPGNPPRLEVSAVSSATDVLAGTPLTVSWTVDNLGSATTNAPWIDALYLSPIVQFAPTKAYLIGLYTNGANLASGAKYTQTQSAVVPRCFYGLYYVSVVTDIGNVVNGISCNTNNWKTSSTTVQVSPSGYASLQVANISLPMAASSGVAWNVQWTVTNAGPAAATGTWSDAVYASLSPVFDSSAELLGRFDWSNDLASHAAYTQNQPVTFPPCTSGQYFVYIVADVDNHVNAAACVVNNRERSAVSLTVNIGSWPDLVVSSVSIPPTAYAGQPTQVSWSVTNAGTARATGSWLDSVYLASGGVFDPPSSLLLGTYPHSAVLAAGASYTQTSAFNLPHETHGQFYAYVVTDSSNAVQECQGETNNVTASPAPVTVPVTLYPDLHVAFVQAPGRAYAGQVVNVSWIVTNKGTDATPGGAAWNDAIFLSKDEVLDPSDVRLANSPSPTGLGVGQSYTNSATIQIPAGAAGPYYILVLADSGAKLFEHLGYNDSLGWNQNAMLVSLPPRADVAASSVTVSPPSGAPGDAITIGWAVRNASTNDVPSEWTDALYLSTNKFWDINAMEVARRDHSGLAASAAYSDSWTGPMPALTPGVYYALLRTDVRNTVRETNFVNNVAVSSSSIAVDVSVLVLGQPQTNELTTGTSQYYKVSLPAGETVRVKLTGASTNSFNELFVRYGAVPDLQSYDFLYAVPFSPSQQVDIPSTQAGWYYIMVRGGNEPNGPLAYALEADIVPFGISSVSQNHVGDYGQVTITVKGAKFQAGATVQLVSDTNFYSAATNLFTDATSVRARFVFTNAVHGIYDLVLMNPNHQSTIAAQAVTIEEALPLSAQVLPGPINTEPRVGLPFNWIGAVANTGNIDIQYLTVGVAVDQQFNVALSPPAEALLAATNSTDNSEGACMFLARDIPPGVSLGFSFIISGFGSQAFYYGISPVLLTKQAFLNQIENQAEAVRQIILTNPTALSVAVTNSQGIITTNAVAASSAFLSILSEAGAWDSYYAQSLVAGGLLDEKDIAELPASQSSSMQRQSIPSQRGGRAVPKDQRECDYCLLQYDLATIGNDILTGLCIAGAMETCELPPVCIALVWKCTREGLARQAIIYANYQLCLLKCRQPAPCTSKANNAVCPPPSRDPNEMHGPNGYSNARYVGSLLPWQYAVYFENTSNALAFPRQIVITNALDPSFDVRTFRVSEITFGNVTISVPANRSYYQTRIAAPYPNPTNIVVDVTAGVDVQHRTISLTLNAIDLNTGQLVENADLGVLPPNTTNHIGEGHITYAIKPRSSVLTGTVVTNQAAIVFDTNDPIDTNTTTNTIDAVAPSSSVVSLPPVVFGTNVTVSWFGNDDPNGSGVGSFDIYFSDNGGPWQLWLSGVTQNSATFSGQPQHYYYFYSIAHDNAGNVETPPSGFQAMTYISDNKAPALQPVVDQTISVGQSLLLTNVAVAPSVSQRVSFTLEDAPSGAAIDPNTGVLSWSPTCDQGSTTNLITVVAANSGNPPLSNSMSFLIVVPECAEVGIDSTLLQTGQHACVPVNLFSSVTLTNLSFAVACPPNRLTNWAISATNPVIGSATVKSVNGSGAIFTLSSKPGQVFQGPAVAGTICFDALPGASAFVPLTISNVAGTKPDGSPVGSAVGQPGQVVVIGREPLLEARLGTNAQTMITLFGNPGSSYAVGYRTNIQSGAWQEGWHVSLTNLARTFFVDTKLPAAFYRSWEISSNLPSSTSPPLPPGMKPDSTEMSSTHSSSNGQSSPGNILWNIARNAPSIPEGQVGRRGAPGRLTQGNASQAEAPAHLSDVQSAAIPGLLLGASYTNGVLTLQFPSEANRHYRVEFRDVLVAGSWAPLPGSDNLAGTGAPLIVTKATDAARHRYYRVVRLP